MHACSVSLCGTGFLVRDVRDCEQSTERETVRPRWRGKLATDRGKLETYDGSPKSQLQCGFGAAGWRGRRAAFGLVKKLPACMQEPIERPRRDRPPSGDGSAGTNDLDVTSSLSLSAPMQWTLLSVSAARVSSV